jgi:hypothetical protein
MEEAAMNTPLFRSLTLLAFTAAITLSHVAPAQAQLTQARSVNMENARRLYSAIISDLGADKRGDAAKRLEEFSTNLDVVEAALYRPARETLQEPDRSVLFPKVEDTTNLLGKSRVAASTLLQRIKTGDSLASGVDTFKDSWTRFDDRFKRLSEEFTAYWTQTKERVRRLQEVCGRDCS